MQPNAFRLLKIIHTALMAGMFLFVFISLVMVLTHHAGYNNESLQRALQVACVALSIACIWIGFTVFKRKIFVARNSVERAEIRMDGYRSACILWWALIEGPGWLAAICFWLTGNFAFFALAVVHMLILLMFSPRKGNIILFLKLDSREVKVLEGTA